VQAFDEGLDLLKLSKPGIPEFAELNQILNLRSGWEVVAVPGLVPDSVFFSHLANRRFPAGNFIRRRDQLDYIEEPDVFHDLFGHVPMLSDRDMADWVQRLGTFGGDAHATGTLPMLARLYWRTVEFGLTKEEGELRILGAGIVSSFGESEYALASAVPERRPFDLAEVLITPYRSDDFQDLYFVIDDLAVLVAALSAMSWSEIIAQETGR
jgi:phenylalanine-4-hydroxylase